jgi:Mrp family chromosome partitioning ATPase
VRYLEDRLATLQGGRVQSLGAERELRDLQRAATVSAQKFEGLLRRQAELSGQDAAQPYARLVSSASIPEVPSSPPIALFIMPALAFALMIGGVLAVILERLDHGLRSEQDITDALGISCVGLLPRVKRRQHPPYRLLKENPSAPYSEAVRALVLTMLQRRKGEGQPRSFLVTSSRTGEGKSTLAVSFATYAVELRLRVLLVNLDMSNPGILEEAEESTGTGVLDIPAGTPISKVARSRPELGFDYLTLPRQDISPADLLTGGQLPAFIARARREYDCVVIDGPPLLESVEARVLTSLVDRVIFATKWGATPWEQAQRALQQTQLLGLAGDLQKRIVAVVVQADMKQHIRYRYDHA